jgi:ankyrin repeat protein
MNILFRAARLFDAECKELRVALEENPEIDLTAEHNPLHPLFAANTKAAVLLLVQRGAPVDLKDKGQYTALMLAPGKRNSADLIAGN